MDADHRAPLDEFLQFWEQECQGRTKLFRQFHLIRWRFLEGRMDVNATRFWNLVGSHMTKLKLNSCKGKTSGELFQLVNRHLPNLESMTLFESEFGEGDYEDWEFDLKFKYGSQYKEPAHGEHPKLKSLYLSSHQIFGLGDLRITYLELLSHFPHVASFRMDTGDRQEIADFLFAVKEIRMQDPSKLPITHLANGDHPVVFQFGPFCCPCLLVEGDDNRQDGLLNLLRELRITVETIRLEPQNMSQNEMQNVVEFNGPTLRKFFAWRATSDEPHPRFNFPFGVQLPKLEELQMSESFCENFEFINYTPNLENLRIWIDSNSRGEPRGTTVQGPIPTFLISSASKPELANTQLLKLTTLSLQDMIVSEDDLRWMIWWMPCVKNLRMILNDKQFSIVCEGWQTLVQLRVLGRELTDKGVTGLRIQHQMTTRSGREIVKWEDGEPPVPNVSCLQNLEVFIAREATLTEVSLTHGLLKLDRLRRIYFANSDELGPKAKKTLREMDIKTSRCEQYDFEFGR